MASNVFLKVTDYREPEYGLNKSHSGVTIRSRILSNVTFKPYRMSRKTTVTLKVVSNEKVAYNSITSYNLKPKISNVVSVPNIQFKNKLVNKISVVPAFYEDGYLIQNKVTMNRVKSSYAPNEILLEKDNSNVQSKVISVILKGSLGSGSGVGENIDIILEIFRGYQYVFSLPEHFLEGLQAPSGIRANGDNLYVRINNIGRVICYTDHGSITFDVRPGMRVPVNPMYRMKHI